MKKKVSRKSSGPAFVFSGTIAPVSGKWHAIYFETDDEGADEESVTTLPVACWAACVRGKEHIVGGMVAGMHGLELAELDRDFRGYVVGDGDDEKKAFLELWEDENGFGSDEDDDGEEETDEEE